MYSRKREEYIADFCLVSRRELDAFEHQLFRYHYLLGADCKLCCRQLHLDRGNYFHAIYRIENHLGQLFADLQPYPLYPLDEYFGGVFRREARRTPATAFDPAGRGTAVPVPLPLSA